jgi:hypothetical protein
MWHVWMAQQARLDGTLSSHGGRSFHERPDVLFNSSGRFATSDAWSS